MAKEKNTLSATIYRKQNVHDAALDRIRWLFDEFPNIVVGVSGGKDSTVVFNLALQVAREKGRLPLTVMWLDQEAEWQATVDTVEKIMTNPDVDPLWLQIPFRLFNATSATDHWLDCWEPGKDDKWMRPHHPLAKTENIYGTDRFTDLFTKILKAHWPDTPTAYLAGVRTEESPARFIGLTGNPSWKWATWGKVLDKSRDHVTMYPIYDWHYADVWKAIHENGWDYNPIYDAMYSYGVPVRGMRVSNVHHETAVHALFYLQEIEPATWARLTQRIGGIDTAGKFGADDFFVSELPFMFSGWNEYRDYLLQHLILEEDLRDKFAKRFAAHDELYAPVFGEKKVARTHIQSILTNDHEFVKIKNFEANPIAHRIRKEHSKQKKET